MSSVASSAGHSVEVGSGLNGLSLQLTFPRIGNRAESIFSILVAELLVYEVLLSSLHNRR